MDNLAHDVMDLFTTVIINCGHWFTTLLSETGMDDVYLTYVFIFLCVSILILPVIGGRIPFGNFIGSGSDQARRK